MKKIWLLTLLMAAMALFSLQAMQQATQPPRTQDFASEKKLLKACSEYINDGQRTQQQLKTAETFMARILLERCPSKTEQEICESLHSFSFLWQQSLEPLVRNMARVGNYEAVAQLLAFGADKDTKDASGHTPLHIAVNEGHIEIARLLLQQNAQTETHDYLGFTPLHSVASKGDEKMVQLLLDYKADKEGATAQRGWRPLHCAAAQGHLPVVILLLARGAAREAVDQRGVTPLHEAALGGHLKVVLHLSSGADVEKYDRKGNTALHWASCSGNTDLIRILVVNLKADKEAQDIYGRRPLHKAADFGKVEAVRYLLAEGVSCDCRTSKHDPLFPYMTFVEIAKKQFGESERRGDRSLAACYKEIIELSK